MPRTASTSTPTRHRGCGPSRPWTWSTRTGRSAPSGCARWPLQIRSTAITTAMGNLWWDRPITVSSIDIGAGSATLHVLTPYNAAQDIELRTNDAGMVDRFAVTMRPPVITEMGRHRRGADQVGGALLVSGLQGGPRWCGRQVRFNCRHQHRSVPSARFDLQTLCAACGCGRSEGGHGELERLADHHRAGQGGRIGGPRGTASRCRRCRCAPRRSR